MQIYAKKSAPCMYYFYPSCCYHVKIAARERAFNSCKFMQRNLLPVCTIFIPAAVTYLNNGPGYGLLPVA
jgi:mannitol-specific phosphotransferase system IIBC component